MLKQPENIAGWICKEILTKHNVADTNTQLHH